MTIRLTRATSCIGMGIVAQTFGSCRAYCAATAPARLRRGWPAGCPYHAPAPGGCPAWIGQPGCRVYELDGQVLLLGVDHTANTTIHLASMRRARYRRKKYVTLLKRAYRFDYTEIDHCCQNFSLVDGWLESEGLRLQRRQTVGRASEGELRPIERCDPDWSGKNSTERGLSLHPFGVDDVMMRLSLSRGIK